MDLAFITQNYNMIVLIACLIVGYILKVWIKDIDNKFIPTILAILGAIIYCISEKDLNLSNIVYGALTGLASTGLHQAFKQIIHNKSEN